MRVTTTVKVCNITLDVEFSQRIDGVGLLSTALGKVSVPDGCGDNILPILAQNVVNEVVRQVRDQQGIKRDGYSWMRQYDADRCASLGGMNPHTGAPNE